MKKLKLAKILAPTLMVLPLTSMVIASCSKSIQKTIADDLISEFLALCEYSRPTYHTRDFCKYVASRAKDLSKEPITVIDDRDSYTPTELFDDSGYNMYYDISANVPKDADEPPMIIIQCHTDMVWVVKDGYEDFITHPEPVSDRIYDEAKKKWINVIHTKNYLSSLGADNGIGVAACLALTKHAKDFYHGPIRFMFTTDEEDGDSGAIDVLPSWFKYEDGLLDIQYLLNIDLEQIYNLGISCGGVQQAFYRHKFDIIEDHTQWSEAQYQLVISGLLGGHSAQVINEPRLNSIVLAAQLLQKLSEVDDDETPYETGVQLATISELGDLTAKPNRVCDSIVVNFTSNLSIDRIKQVIRMRLRQIIADGHQNETNIEWEIKPQWIGLNSEPAQEYGVISKDDTLKILNLITGTPENPGLHQGVWDWYDKDGDRKQVKTSNNIGCIRLHDGRYSKMNPKGELYIETFGRSSDIDDLGPEDFDEKNPKGFMAAYKQATDFFIGDPGKDKNEWDKIAWNNPWARKDDDKLQPLLMEAAQHFKYELNPSDRIGWLELAAFFAITHGQINMAAIGPTVPNVHTCNEMVYVDTVEPLINMILYTLENLGKE